MCARSFIAAVVAPPGVCGTGDTGDIQGDPGDGGCIPGRVNDKGGGWSCKPYIPRRDLSALDTPMESTICHLAFASPEKTHLILLNLSKFLEVIVFLTVPVHLIWFKSTWIEVIFVHHIPKSLLGWGSDSGRGKLKQYGLINLVGTWISWQGWGGGGGVSKASTRPSSSLSAHRYADQVDWSKNSLLSVSWLKRGINKKTLVNAQIHSIFHVGHLP